MSTFSKPAIVVDTISDAIMAKISNHVPSEQVHSESPAHWWSDEPATLKASVAGAVIMDKDGNFFEIFKDKPVITRRDSSVSELSSGAPVTRAAPSTPRSGSRSTVLCFTLAYLRRRSRARAHRRS